MQRKLQLLAFGIVVIGMGHASLTRAEVTAERLRDRSTDAVLKGEDSTSSHRQPKEKDPCRSE